MTSFAPIRVDLVETACRTAIEAIRDARRRMEIERVSRPSGLTRSGIEFHGAEQERVCRALLALCDLAHVSGQATVNVSAEDALSFSGHAAAPRSRGANQEADMAKGGKGCKGGKGSKGKPGKGGKGKGY
jgi:hypothetical protein